ncbi:SLAIN motif-containing protein 2-like isoform X2 [Mercenaria mercenaria]|uniref:SLAIN motif-containing protein 2-like isoform X2 n=1 Tax=Mercenaria mercenaria TaxID=6596 RepID=UPI00234EF3D8|nr:SLAIN motif-containing protein 2-like isoform X2 [Mercenaria mercenaria]
MTTILDINEGGIDPEAEVRKLQDLVKKLETQNEVLRRKQKLSTSNDSNIIENNENEVLKPALNNSVFYNTRKHLEKRDISLRGTENLDGVELIDVDASIPDDEDSWLYTSPRPPTPQQHRVSPYKYMRQDLDNPSPDVQSAKRSLKYKLDEVARMSRSSSTPAFQNYSTPPRNNGTAMSLSADSTPSPRIMKPTAKASPLHTGIQVGSKINTGTFTRPKRNKPSPIQTSTSDDSKENIETVHHPNVADIENLAKMQEESLRQSIAQTSPRRGFRSRPLPNVAASNNTDSNSGSPADSNRSSPAHFEEGSYRRNSQNSVESDHSSPPDSPYGSNQHLHQQNSGGVSNLRGSMPNMSRLIPRAQHYNSDSSLADYQEEQAINNAEPPRYTRLQNSMARPSSPSVSGLKPPQRNIRGGSPQRSGLPTPRRSIPRPGSAGTPRSPGVPTPKRISGLPAPRLSQARPKDESWREGCF